MRTQAPSHALQRIRPSRSEQPGSDLVSCIAVVLWIRDAVTVE